MVKFEKEMSLAFFLKVVNILSCRFTILQQKIQVIYKAKVQPVSYLLSTWLFNRVTVIILLKLLHQYQKKASDFSFVSLSTTNYSK